MNLDEFGKWSPYNSDNPKYAPDEYNRSFIKERFECPKEYEGSDFDEYYSVPKMTDSFEFKKEKDVSDDKKSKDKNTRQLRQNMIRQVACLAAGSVVITTSYQSVIKQQQQAAVPDVPSYSQTDEAEDNRLELSSNWVWSDDFTSATLELSDKDGNIITKIGANIEVSGEEATCNKEGTRISTATPEYEDENYSDEKSEEILPLGHDFDEGKEVVLQNGNKAMTFKCSRCHEEFTVETSMTEND